MNEPADRRRSGRLSTYWLAGMSPRRRALALSVLLLVLTAVAVAAIAVSRAGNNAAGGPNRPALPPQDRPGPVLLIPGYGGNTGSLDALASRIAATGRAVTIVRLPGSGTNSLSADAAALNLAVNKALRHGAPSVDVIGYSAGGVVALVWARRDNGAARARRIVTLGSPFHGTQLASAAEGLVPGFCPIACRQLIPGSQLLVSLHAGSPDGLPRWLSLWTTDDMVVTPPDSARLAGAIDVPVQSLCPSLYISHSDLPTNPAVTAMVLRAIGSTPLRRPSSTDCRG